MKIVLGSLLALCLSVPGWAQTVPPLAKSWSGTLTATSIGPGAVSLHSPHHPTYVGPEAAKGFKTLDEPFALEIVRQEGRHIEAVVKTKRHSSPWIATLSADGKQLQVATATAHYTLQIDGSRMSGCGSGHFADGSFNAICVDFTMVKQ